MGDGRFVAIDWLERLASVDNDIDYKKSRDLLLIGNPSSSISIQSQLFIRSFMFW